MTTGTQQTNSRRWLPVLQAALIAALAAILLGTTASASAAVGAETRVGAFNVAGEVPVEPPEHIAAGQRLGNDAARPVFVVATGVAAKNEHSLLQRALMDRRLNPERGSIGGGGFTGSATTHGAERLAEAGFDDIDVAIIRAGRSFEQTDGATAFVSSTGRDSFNMIVQNSDGVIVTAHRGMTYDDLAGLAQNYRWSGW
ncbi:MAG: hypothetical protein R2731_00065 [Nocardioides sp.]